MYRRRRRPEKEIHFSFDSFLDLVANVVGIIIRLILVAWVGARSYTGLFQPSGRAGGKAEAVGTSPLPPLTREQAAVEQARLHLAEARAALVAQMKEQELLRSQQAQTVTQLAALDGERRKLEEESATADARRQQVEQGAKQVELSLAEVRRRAERLAGEIAALKKLPPAKKTLRYQTPVAQAVQSEELQFECRHGQVTFVDVEALLREVRRNLRPKAQQLRSQWEVEAETGAAGAFRLRYVVARERGLLDGGSGSVPDARADFRYGLDGWVAVPMTAERGETTEAALRPGSEFRRIVDRIDAEQTAVTFWVYPDSFAAYRRLRDYLLRRDVLVAGRPLPEDFPIASSRSGTVSQGQ